MGTCFKQGVLCRPSQEPMLDTADKKNSEEVLGKKAGGTGRVEISKEEIPGSKRNMHGNVLTYSRL